jgi:hypothetical protein
MQGDDVILLDTYRAVIDTRECTSNTSSARTRSAMSQSFETELATAIEEADAEEATGTEFFNANGIKTNGMTSGVNIIKYTDGTVKKVIRK